MVKHKRINREEIDKDIDLLKPIDIFSLGTEDDPCFGKYHDLKAPECMDCGDAEFCAIVKSQNMKIERLKIETKRRFKDIEESDKVMEDKINKAKVLITQDKELGKKRVKTILKVSRKLKLDKKRVKNLYDKL